MVINRIRPILDSAGLVTLDTKKFLEIWGSILNLGIYVYYEGMTQVLNPSGACFCVFELHDLSRNMWDYLRTVNFYKFGAANSHFNAGYSMPAGSLRPPLMASCNF